MFDMEYFSKQLRVKRAERGWSQDDLAKESGVSRNAIVRYESGLNEPMFTSVCALADAFGCPIGDFVIPESAA